MLKQTETVPETVTETAKQISIEMVRLFRPIATLPSALAPRRQRSAFGALAAHRSHRGGIGSVYTPFIFIKPLAEDTMTDDIHDDPKHELTTIPAKPVRERRVSPRVRHAVDLLLTGECRLKKDAAAKAGLTPERLSRALKESHVAEYVTRQTHVLLATAQVPAAATMLRLLDNAKSEHVQKDVAIHLLGINGHKPTADPVSRVNISIQAGYVIDLREEPMAPAIDVTPNEPKGD